MFAVELTGDYRHAAAAARRDSAPPMRTTVLLLKRSILTEKIARRGQHITREYSIDPGLPGLQVDVDGQAGRYAARGGGCRGGVLHRP